MCLPLETPTRARILIVDDEPLITTTMAEILKSVGHETETAFSGEEAVVRAASFRPHLLVTDVNMGAMNGVAAAGYIIMMEPSCKVLFISGAASLETVRDLIPKNMVYRFAAKPVPIPSLLNAVTCMLSIENACCEELESADECAFRRQAPREPGSSDVPVRPSARVKNRFSAASEYGPAVSSSCSPRHVA